MCSDPSLFEMLDVNNNAATDIDDLNVSSRIWKLFTQKLLLLPSLQITRNKDEYILPRKSNKILITKL